MTPRQIHDTLIIGVTVALIALTLLDYQQQHVLAIVPLMASVVALVLLPLHLRGWRYARHGVVITSALAISLSLPEPFVTVSAPMVLLLPPILALVLVEPIWVPASLLLQVGVLLLRADGQGVYTHPITLLLLAMMTGGLLLHHSISAYAGQQARLAQAEAERQAVDLARQRDIARWQSRLLEVVQQAVIAVDKAGIVLFWNPHAEQLFGVRAAEALGRPVDELMVNDALRIRGMRLMERLRNGKSWTGEILIQLRNGSSFPALVVSTPVLDELGEVTAIVSLTVDLTAQKQAEQSLRESERRYRLIAEGTSDLVCLLNSQYEFAYASPSFLRVLNYEPHLLLNQSFWNLLQPEDRPAAERAFKELSSHEHLQISLRLKHANGNWRSCEVLCSSVQEDQQSYFLLAARDVSERLQFEGHLRQVQKMEAIGQLAGGIAHDFNNLLVAIGGYASFIRDELPQDHTVQPDVREIERSVERAAGLTRQLLTFARRQVVDARTFSLNELLIDLKKLLRRVIGEQISMITIQQPQLWPVHADPGQIEQVILNLVINARDAMAGSENGKIVIETRNVILDRLYAERNATVQPGAYVLLTISDTGIGMSPEVLERAFEPFFTTKPPGQGSGLGLATSYGIIRQCGGAIMVYSEPGRGTTFKIYLPHASKTNPELLVPAVDEPPLRGSEVILIVEDEAGVRSLAARVLLAYGYQVLQAANGHEALALIQQEILPAIDLLLSDVVLPGINGRIVANQLLQYYPNLKVLYMSGYTDNMINHHEQLEPGIAFLQKPFSPTRLARKVREVLDAPT